MGNKLGRKRQAIDEKYTRPQGLYENIDVDYKKLRKLILRSRLAPCYPGNEESSNDREECPICLLYYPSLNRSRCCMKGICTECFLQMKSFHSVRAMQCPFCKSFDYGVDYRGMMTKEEKDLEQIEEQKVIEARIRMQQQERIEEERLERERVERRELPSSSNSGQNDEIESAQVSPYLPASRRLLQPRQSGAGEFDADLEDLMVMEAIWASICDSGLRVGGGPFPGPSSTARQAGGHGAEGDVIRGSVGPVRRVGEGEDYLRGSGRGDSFEEQMVLALAISLAEARSRRTDSGVTEW